MAYRALTVFTALCLEATSALDVVAAPQQLDCVLSDTETSPQSEKRPVIVVFDQEAKTLAADEGGQQHRFEKVSISNVSITGHANGVTIGIDRSSLGIVWQRYETDLVHTEFGHCRPAEAPK